MKSVTVTKALYYYNYIEGNGGRGKWEEGRLEAWENPHTCKTGSWKIKIITKKTFKKCKSQTTKETGVS